MKNINFQALQPRVPQNSCNIETVDEYMDTICIGHF